VSSVSSVLSVLSVFVSVLSVLPCNAQEATAVQPTSPITNFSPGIPFTYVPITPEGRVYWIVDGIVGLKSLGVGVLGATWQTAFDIPEEWGRTWSGFGKRYLAREVDVAISNTLEAGVGSIWGEEPRYIPSHRQGIWPRSRHAMKTVFLTQRRDGHLAPAWGRYLGNTLNNVIENAWLPPSVTTPGQTALRSANGFLGRLGGNLFDEFWPDVWRWLSRRQ
jgi:hypothetical protein